MKISTEKEITAIIQQDKWMMNLLKATSSLNLPDWWICAGFVRAKIWDVLHGFDERTPTPDIDVIYYDPINIDEKTEKNFEKALKELLPTIPWSVKNQARMHVANNIPPYSSAVDAISKFPEIATALGVKLDDENNVRLTAPHGIDEVVNMEVNPTPYFRESKGRMLIFEKRLRDKNWQAIWKRIKV
ncbi:nucleotidyltransferase family protein [Sporosarcina sp. Marseille-Q4063]|uniref:nucleotidyltransferase family protein n=1 Tax=Sporosarcina sp. Marseille-Q4063 TaxID=2810514 RepID=UPI001BAEF68F|nr:nucleotidyltransferase family protein [Sporosarcina sp. Marseille-Q4063]QUW24100.1 nucleotidyltransferase family protein [Sporosarcina sp. Marseille-Q4063]